MPESRIAARICVVGAGSSGLAACKALQECGIGFDCFERGSDVGGNWRYLNDSGIASCYASLHTNVSRTRMQYPSFPMPADWGDYISHAHMAQYLGAFADRFGLRRHIHFRTILTAAHQTTSSAWEVTTTSLAEESRECTQQYDALIVATGHDWDPNWPEFDGSFSGRLLHTHEYRNPEAFAGQRVLVIGAGNSASEIAVELASVASRVYWSFRHTAHIVPRYVFGIPADQYDTPLSGRLPWPLVRWTFERILRLARGRLTDYGLPEPNHRLLMAPPALTSGLLPALREGRIHPRPAVVRFGGLNVEFADGSHETVDAVVCGTGYKISFPFLDERPLRIKGKSIPLYRRIVPPDVHNLYFVGLVDALGGLLPVVELQSEWVADVLSGIISLPERSEMWAAAEAGEPRSRERFGAAGAYSILCDQWAYRRTLRDDLQVAQPRWNGLKS